MKLRYKFITFNEIATRQQSQTINWWKEKTNDLFSNLFLTHSISSFYLYLEPSIQFWIAVHSFRINSKKYDKNRKTNCFCCCNIRQWIVFLLFSHLWILYYLVSTIHLIFFFFFFPFISKTIIDLWCKCKYLLTSIILWKKEKTIEATNEIVFVNVNVRIDDLQYMRFSWPIINTQAHRFLHV